MVIAIDFDGTIVEHEYPAIGKLLPDAEEVINKLYDDGHYIIIWTCRSDDLSINQMIDFLNKEEIHYHKVNENAPYSLIHFSPAPKILAHVYIDDRMVGGLPEWKEIYRLISGEEL